MAQTRQSNDASAQESASAARTTQSENSLSRAQDDAPEDDGRFSIAEEVNFDEQSDQARHVGDMPEDIAGVSPEPAEAMSDSLKKDQQDAPDELRQAIERSVPPPPLA